MDAFRPLELLKTRARNGFGAMDRAAVIIDAIFAVRAIASPHVVAAVSVMACLSIAPAAWSYDEALHALLDARAYDGSLASAEATAPALATTDALRALVWEAGTTHPDPALQLSFRARYPSFDKFDGWAFKELLGLNPDRPVDGIDRLPSLPPRTKVGQLLSLGSRLPDDDGRNQNRFAHDGQRQVRHTPFGDPLPADPLQLTFGPLQGIASQAYAHYGLPKVVYSDDPATLQTDPRRFGYPTWIVAYGPQFAQLHTELAICAAALGTPEGLGLGWLLLGNAHHYIQDVANQIHTLQGVYAFFIDAKAESWKEQLFSLGGLLRPRRGFLEIAIGIIRNHHHLTEQLFAKRVRERTGELKPESGPLAARVVMAEDPLGAIIHGDGQLERVLDRALGLANGGGDRGDVPFGQLIAEALVEASSYEGAAVYDAVHAVADRRFSRAGVTFDLGDDPDRALRPAFDGATLARFYHLQTLGFARAGSALRRHVKVYRATLAAMRMDDASRQQLGLRAARRLIATQLRWKEASERRLAAYIPSPPLRKTVDLWVPLAVGLLPACGGLWLTASWRRRKRRIQQPPPQH